MKKYMKAALVGTAGVVLFGAGIGVGLGDVPEPVAVTKTVEVPKEVVKEVPKEVVKTEYVDKAPQACKQALSDAEKLFSLYGDALGIAGDAVQQSGTWDVEGLKASTKKLQDLQLDMDPFYASYLDASSQCKAAK